MGSAERRKGAAFERWVARELQRAGLEARRGLQARGGEEVPDVLVVDACGIRWWVECKRRATPPTWSQIRGWWERLRTECPEGDLPALIVRADRRPTEVVLRALVCEDQVLARIEWSAWLEVLGAYAEDSG